MPITTYHGPTNPNPKHGEARIIIYGYVPSMAMALVGVVTFGIIALINLWYTIKRKGYRTFHILMMVGSLMELGGYAARAVSHKSPFKIGPFIAQYFLIVVSPVLFTAAIYLSLSLAINGYSVSRELLMIRPKLVLIIFITADIITTIIQVLGAALIGVSESDVVSNKKPPVQPDQANDILLAGLAVQCAAFLTFLSILITAIWRATRSTFSPPNNPNADYRQLRRFLFVILATSDLILLRTTFRLAEEAQGFFGFASTHEYLFGVLEFAPVILAVGIWAIFPPGRFLTHLSGQAPALVEEKHTRGAPGQDAAQSV